MLAIVDHTRCGLMTSGSRLHFELSKGKLLDVQNVIIVPIQFIMLVVELLVQLGVLVRIPFKLLYDVAYILDHLLSA